MFEGLFYFFDTFCDARLRDLTSRRWLFYHKQAELSRADNRGTHVWGESSP